MSATLPPGAPDLGGMARWPNVPACYGWLSLDRRGQWRMQGEPVTHAGLASFLNRQYGHDEDGNYFVQNGPQRVFVELDYTPWVARLASTLAPQNQRLALETHTGTPIDALLGALFDEEGNLLLEFSQGIALLCDRDLPALLDCLRQPDGTAASDDAVLELLQPAPGTLTSLTLLWNGKPLPLRLMQRSAVAQRYGFIAHPAP